MRPRLSFVLAALILFTAGLSAQQVARDSKKEQVICDKLAAVAPAAVDTFKRATVAMDKRDYQQSAQLYREVLQQAPQFTPAMRRLGFSLVGLGHTDEALTLLENAVQVERSPENLISLAEVLAYPGENKQGTPEQKARALPLAKEATALYQSRRSQLRRVDRATRVGIKERRRFSPRHGPAGAQISQSDGCALLQCHP